MKRDETALYTLFISSVRRSYNSIRSVCGDKSAAKKLTEEAYVLSFGNIDRLEHPESFSIWMDSLSVYTAQKYSQNASASAFGKDFAKELSQDDLSELWQNILARLENADKEKLSSEFGSAINQIKTDSFAGREKDLSEFKQKELTRLGLANAKLNMRFHKRRVFILLILIFLIVALIIAVGLRKKSDGIKNVSTNIIASIEQGKVLQFAQALSGQLAGQVGEVYQVGEDTYYVVIYLNSQASGGSLVRYSAHDGSAEVIGTSGAILTAEQLQQIADDPYLQVDYAPVPKPEKPKDPLQIAVDAAGTKELDAKDNSLSINGKDLDEILKRAEDEEKKLAELFGKEPPEENFNIVLTIKCRNVNLEKTARIKLDRSISDKIGKAGRLAVVLGDERHVIGLSKEQLEMLCNRYESVTVEITALSGYEYKIDFRGENSDPIDQLFGTVEITLPADSELTYVYADYGRISENRGGRFDKTTKTISFDCRLSGEYSLVGNNVEIADIQGENTEVQFMASTGFIPLDETGRFRPDDVLSRNEMILALGKMFLSVDNGSGASNTHLTDVNPSDDEYAYIVAAATDKIVLGQGNGIFDGERGATREELITCCARTLKARNVEIPDGENKKSARECFSDADSISGFAIDSVETAIQAELIDNSGKLRPGELVTRAEAAGILYRLYRYLY